MGGSTKLMSSGAGGVILTTPGSIAADVTVNLPTQNCTLDIQGPAFSVYAGTSTSVPNVTSTKIILNTEEYDTANCFINSRFTPNVAGYYQVNGAVYLTGSTIYGSCGVFKNGASYREGPLLNGNGAGITTIVSCQVYLNGTTDYIELYGYQATGATQTAQAVTAYTYFQGVLVRAA